MGCADGLFPVAVLLGLMLVCYYGVCFVIYLCDLVLFCCWISDLFVKVFDDYGCFVFIVV